MLACGRPAVGVNKNAQDGWCAISDPEDRPRELEKHPSHSALWIIKDELRQADAAARY
jgi:hypothetical protein